MDIAQDYEYTGDDQWKWWVWLDGDDAELDRVAAVEYHLHPTFPNPVREIRDRESKFQLAAHGWGVFELKAQVRLKDGSSFSLGHMLELAYPPGFDDSPAPEKAPTRGVTTSEGRTVFLSSGSADSDVASELRSSLIDRGVHVWSDEDSEPGVPWELEIERAIGKADAMVALSSDIPSKWVEREVGAAAKYGTKVIPVVVGDNAAVPKGLESTAQIRLETGGAVGAATEKILRAIEG